MCRLWEQQHTKASGDSCFYTIKVKEWDDWTDDHTDDKQDVHGP